MRRIFQQLNNIWFELRSRLATIPTRIQYDTPYVCQFAVPESAEKSLRNELNASKDPDWQETGASSPERYAEWAFTMCGMASTAMALGYLKNLHVKPAELAEDALAHHVYIEESDGLSSMRYLQFATWIKKYGMHAKIYSRLSVRGIQHALSQSMLVTGYDIEKGTISINNPSGFASTNTQINHAVPVGDFKKYYAGRGIVLSN